MTTTTSSSDATARLAVPASRPRNPCAVPARFRQAGAHGRQPGTERRAMKRALRHELTSLSASGPGRPPSL
jgi:hypothetical protein